MLFLTGQALVVAFHFRKGFFLNEAHFVGILALLSQIFGLLGIVGQALALRRKVGKSSMRLFNRLGSAGNGSILELQPIKHDLYALRGDRCGRKIASQLSHLFE